VLNALLFKIAVETQHHLENIVLYNIIFPKQCCLFYLMFSTKSYAELNMGAKTTDGGYCEYDISPSCLSKICLS
jgi:hypothetical protein